MSDYIQHYGILGMRWGVRRTPEQLGHKRKAKNKAKTKISKSKAADDYLNSHVPDYQSTKTSAAAFYKNRSHYTTEQLTAINNRKAQEKRLQEFMASESGKKQMSDRIKAGKEILSFLDSGIKTFNAGYDVYKKIKGRSSESS